MVTELATQQRWKDLCHSLGISPLSDQYQQLIQAYNEPQRAYHTIQHLNECLALVDWAQQQGLAQCTDLLELALWFHDAVYIPRKSNNEIKSADWACQLYPQHSTIGNELRSLIMITCHSAQAQSAQEQLIIDIDLAILGQSPERFQQYEQQIRAEYRWVPNIIYKKKRTAILQHFFNQPRIYGTDIFYKRLENRARTNLAQVLK
ncbi:MAG: hypothetical protein KAH22_08290 [Thiotrichaceae bacterium]|nr:hypothetical protein [Thiotrichaceae bacterium]